MGAWGTGLYQDDVACDIKAEYVNRLRIGQTNIEATQQIIERNEDSLEDEDDGPVIWLALADTQWKYGRLLPEVKEEALKCIREGIDLEKWKEDKRLYEKRKQVLEQIEKRLLTPQPLERKVTKLELKKTIWDFGDVLLYYLNDEKLKESEWYNKYILLRVVGEDTANIGSLPREYSHEISIIAVYNWIGDEPPTKEKIDNLDFLIEERLVVKNGNILEKKVPLKFCVCFSKRDYNSLPVEVLMRDKKFNKYRHIGRSVGMSWLRRDQIDRFFSIELKRAKEKGVLLDESKN